MRDRESTFSDPAVIALLNERFLPVAIDSHDYRSSKDSDGRFFQAAAFKALLNRPNPDGNRSYQGHYVIHPSGTLLAAQNRRGVRAVKRLLRRALAAHAKHTDAAATWESSKRDRRFDRSAPAGALVLNVYARVRADAGTQPTRGEFARWNAGRAGVDHLWVLPRELRALAPKRLAPGESYPVPRALARRLARFHLVDTVRGEAPKYSAEEVKRADLRVTVARVSSEGQVTLGVSGVFALDAVGEFPRSFRGRLEGELVYDVLDKRFLSFDLIASGTTSGAGRWNPGAPTGTFGLTVGVELPPPSWTSPAVAPHAARDRRSYLSP